MIQQFGLINSSTQSGSDYKWIQIQVNDSSYLESLYTNPHVKKIQKVLDYKTTDTPDDYYYGRSGDFIYICDDQWNLKKIGLDFTSGTSGWNISTGGHDTIVAVIDTGIDLTNEDLQNNLWVNSGEIPGNSTDDDGNGYVDDVNGWNF